MQSPAHFVVGAAICRYVKWRPGGLLLAFASHFALDALPHFEDPSILPRGLSHLVSQLWVWVPPVLAAALIPLALLVWTRFRGDQQGVWLWLYLITGGLLACLPDYLTILLGRPSLIGQTNSGSHQTWFPLYYHLLFTHRPWRPMIALVCVLCETLVLGGGLWLLFRRFPSRSKP